MTPDVSWRQAFQEFAADDQLLHLGGAFVDAQRADFTVQALDRVIADDAEAAEELNRGVDDLLRAFGGGQLGHGSLGRDIVALVAFPRRAVGQQGSTVDGGGHLRGALLGAFVFALLQEFFKSEVIFGDFAKHWTLGLGLTIMVSVALLPRGLIGLTMLPAIWRERRARRAAGAQKLVP